MRSGGSIHAARGPNKIGLHALGRQIDEQHANAKHPSRQRRIKWTLGIFGTVVVVVLGSMAGYARYSATVHKAAPATALPATPTTRPRAAALCPLTGTPVPGGGSVPNRPALAVKVDDYSAARPQSGLDKADIVFEEPVEGGITRYVAVFHCQQASLVGPIRSARNIDIGMLGEFGQPLLAHVGGIAPVLANIEASPLINIDLGNYPSVVQNVPGRVAPYDTYASTAALWGLRPDDTTPPAPVFSFSAMPPAGTAVATITIPFSSEADVVWSYSASRHEYLRFYGSSPDEISGGGQESASNVIVQFVQISYGPWVENSEGALEVQANLYDGASGQAEVFRNGEEITGTWQRSAFGSATQFTVSDGSPIMLQPGRTWVELVPDTIDVSTAPPSTGATSQELPATRLRHPQPS
jgi:hypothetical protein